MKQVIIYTDGACRGNPGPGGWGALIRFDSVEKKIFGGQANTTNNQMELSAAIEGLAILKEPCNVELFTDSKYVMDGITQWIQNWKKNNWRTAAKKDVKNKELWQKLDQLIAQHQVQWRWVKGHSGDAGNEAADLLANKGIDSIL
ncbi:ribonuclease HI [Gammaproteobacteria bacterium]|jgi:ribonuclease HI|nr:ribonuclease HI [SAR86 cluster bacterium]MDA8526883.1 ribonuclease HI [Gammaproteobacteria bacterium]MBL6822962.1 ribonuclease HI [SAR86 cluster bacterium]MDA8709735.1 ribonuclease HI [Gammaproteobacteria bacterium]MDA9141184.1 ribonuclease HI [Gammaproteobacteria bacterium]